MAMLLRKGCCLTCWVAVLAGASVKSYHMRPTAPIIRAATCQRTACSPLLRRCDNADQPSSNMCSPARS